MELNISENPNNPNNIYKEIFYHSEAFLKSETEGKKAFHCSKIFENIVEFDIFSQYEITAENYEIILECRNCFNEASKIKYVRIALGERKMWKISEYIMRYEHKFQSLLKY